MLCGAVATPSPSKSLSIFGKNLSRLRSEKGITQEGLAERADIHTRYLQKLESGKAHPSLVVLARIRASLGCDWGELLKSV
jgi:transcriptional regulator with XRE-family HTH domain